MLYLLFIPYLVVYNSGGDVCGGSDCGHQTSEPYPHHSHPQTSLPPGHSLHDWSQKVKEQYVSCNNWQH